LAKQGQQHNDRRDQDTSRGHKDADPRPQLAKNAWHNWGDPELKKIAEEGYRGRQRAQWQRLDADSETRGE
jgi:hypothetical protein